MSPNDRHTGRWPARGAWALAGAFVLAFALVPIAAMFLATLWVDGRFSLASFGEVLATPADRAQLLRTLGLGAVATAVAVLAGGGHAWLTHRTDLPGARWLGPLGVAPLVIPPILVAMGFADFTGAASNPGGTRLASPPVVAGFWACATLLGVAYAPFVAVLAARGLRGVDGRLYEAALLARGRRAANGLLVRMIAPEVAAGALLAFVFVIGEHGVPEFLTVKGKTWHVYAEGVFARWTWRNTGADPLFVNAPIVASLPLVALVVAALALALRLRARATLQGDLQPLPVRRLGCRRWPALLLPAAYLGAGLVVPIVVMARWAAGSTQLREPMSWATFARSVNGALEQSGGDLGYTVAVAAAAAVLVVAVGLPLARAAARGRGRLEVLAVLPVAVPAILLAIGMVKVFNRDAFGRFYDSWAMLACAYAARFLPFAVLPLAQWARRIPPELGEAAVLAGQGPVRRALRIDLPLLAPAAWSAACLVFVLGLRELDTAVVLPAGNGTVVRRLSNIVHFGGEDTGGALSLLLLGVAVLVPALVVILTGRKLRPLA